MANITANNGGFTSTKENLSNLDLRYGPYASVAAAHVALSTDGLCAVGLTVGIINGNKVEEYWYQEGIELSNLVKKQSGVIVDAYTKRESDMKYQPKGNYQPAGDYATEQQLAGKVDKEAGKGLSTNDYTNAEKQKVADALVPADIAGKANVSDVYTKYETYNKTELNNMITTPNQEYVTVTATAQTTAATDLLPATGAADTVYRVGCWDGSQYDDTCYSEYAWNGTTYIKLNTKNVGIDDKLTAGSNKLVKSGTIFDIVGGTSASVFDSGDIEHSSNKDRINVRILKGEKFSLKIEQLDSTVIEQSIQPYVLYKGESQTTALNRFPINVESTFVAEKEIESIGVYFTVTTRGNVRFTISKEEINKTLLDSVIRTDVSQQFSDLEKATALRNLGLDSGLDNEPNGIIKIANSMPPSTSARTLVQGVKAGTYVHIKLSSSTGINTYSGPEEYSVWIEIYHSTDGAIYQLLKTETYSDCELFVETQHDGDILLSIARYGANETLNIEIDTTCFDRVSRYLNAPVNIYNKIGTVVSGSIYRGNLDTSSTTCLAFTEYFDLNIITTGSYIKIGKAANLKIRLNFYDENKTFISQTDYLNTTFFPIKDNYRYVRVSANYDRTITVDDYKEDDFYFVAPIVDSLQDLKRLENQISKVVYDTALAPTNNLPIELCQVVEGKTYQIDITSDTGITYAGSSSGELLTEMFVGNLLERLYSLYKTQTFSPTSFKYKALTTAMLYINPSRWASNERLKVKITEIGTLDKILDWGAEENTMIGIHKEALERVSAAKVKYGSYGSAGENHNICILQMSDSHSDWETVNNGFELANSGYFDILLHTGDIVDGSAQFSQYDWKNRVLGTNIPVLSMSGNHEHEYVANSPIYVGLTDAEVHNILFDSDLVAHNGEIHPTINGVVKNYYYKDVTKNGKTLRLIGLYQFEWNSPTDEQGHPIYGDSNGKDVAFYTQEQIDWLVETLQNTPSEYGVIILSHIALGQWRYLNTPFNSDTLIGYDDGGIMARLSNKFFFHDIIDAFARGTSCSVQSDQYTPDGVNTPISVNTTFAHAGNFIANVCGHHHSGGIMALCSAPNTPSDYKIIMSPCTSSKDVQNTGMWSRDNTRTKDCLNAIIYDFELSKIKVIRIGSDISCFMKEAKMYIL